MVGGSLRDDCEAGEDHKTEKEKFFGGKGKTISEKTNAEIPQIKQYLSPPYYPLSHSQIERWFSTFSQSLRILIKEYGLDIWLGYKRNTKIVIKRFLYRSKPL